MTTKLTESDLNAAIRSDQLREEYWADYRPPLTRVQSWTLAAALGFSVLTMICTAGLFVMWLMD